MYIYEPTTPQYRADAFWAEQDFPEFRWITTRLLAEGKLTREWIEV